MVLSDAFWEAQDEKLLIIESITILFRKEDMIRTITKYILSNKISRSFADFVNLLRLFV